MLREPWEKTRIKCGWHNNTLEFYNIYTSMLSTTISINKKTDSFIQVMLILFWFFIPVIAYAKNVSTIFEHPFTSLKKAWYRPSQQKNKDCSYSLGLYQSYDFYFSHAKLTKYIVSNYLA